jgi:hypothetical protein
MMRRESVDRLALMVLDRIPRREGGTDVEDDEIAAVCDLDAGRMDE